jgi:hypothetical protein
MKTPRLTPQDLDPAPESDEPGLPAPHHSPSSQADGTPDALNQVERWSPCPHAGNGHMGATEDRISDRHAPAGRSYLDEPKQDKGGTALP